MNARVSADGKSIEWLARINLGMAVDTERGLTVPVIQDADHKGMREFGTLFPADGRTGASRAFSCQRI